MNIWNGSIFGVQKSYTATFVALKDMTPEMWRWLDYENLRETARNKLAAAAKRGIKGFFDVNVIQKAGPAKRRYLLTAEDEDAPVEFENTPDEDYLSDEAQRFDDIVQGLAISRAAGLPWEAIVAGALLLPLFWDEDPSGRRRDVDEDQRRRDIDVDQRRRDVDVDQMNRDIDVDRRRRDVNVDQRRRDVNVDQRKDVNVDQMKLSNPRVPTAIKNFSELDAGLLADLIESVESGTLDNLEDIDAALMVALYLYDKYDYQLLRDIVEALEQALSDFEE